MEDLTLAHGRDTAQMFRRMEPAAWRPPGAVRFDHGAANDHQVDSNDEATETPRWLVVVGGGVVAALMGALVGGALQL